jgi:hypothetical protein
VAWVEATRRARERVRALELKLVRARRVVEIQRAASQPVESRVRVAPPDEDDEGPLEEEESEPRERHAP